MYGINSQGFLKKNKHIGVNFSFSAVANFSFFGKIQGKEKS